MRSRSWQLQGFLKKFRVLPASAAGEADPTNDGITWEKDPNLDWTIHASSSEVVVEDGVNLVNWVDHSPEPKGLTDCWDTLTVLQVLFENLLSLFSDIQPSNLAKIQIELLKRFILKHLSIIGPNYAPLQGPSQFCEVCQFRFSRGNSRKS